MLRVVQVDEEQIEIVHFQRFQHRRGVGNYCSLVARSLEQQLKSIEDVFLVIGQKNPSRCRMFWLRRQGHFQCLHVR